MSKPVAINAHIYNLLIKKDLDHFTVTELRAELMAESPSFTDPTEARKFLYRQILRLTDKGYLQKVDKGSRKSAYRKTEKFFSSTFFARGSLPEIQTNIAVSCVVTGESEFLKKLKGELVQFEAELSLTLREMGKYQALISSFPEQAEYIKTFFHSARQRAKNLQGDLEAINNLIMHHPKNLELC
ncbi:hypothetical protein LRP50_24350 [Enterovibrio sp. ZSDZ42]|uniref:Transcriptional regulator VspR n=1 Tax=Enterovibrio gelatinilyticus TaxID=2899819 RepID=A0ABT5R949_9GAMM|nr:hypothetical protein [Enterovibrio sp. ZSDZ42]MDD1796256.1 hypothetical protein [Enterovibrio sp. ZSDZ42]